MNRHRNPDKGKTQVSKDPTSGLASGGSGRGGIGGPFSPHPHGPPQIVDPIIIKDHYEIDYSHSYAQDSPFFAALAKGKLLGSRCIQCGYTYATPRSHCMQCGSRTDWIELPQDGRVHTYTTCYYSGEAFLKETPFTLILVEFEQVNTLFLSRLKNVNPEGVSIGMPVIAQFVKRPKFKVTDVYFVPREKS
jgi:uncharacterized OB-fold protein